jgi:alkanesulfonate monooxygenase SsuD/methylene tetrahydromethanopterin reductase-like flavin-dependent oxidoreductase (luciferase family)
LPDPPPPIIFGGFGPKMAALAGQIADGINLPDGPGVGRLLDVARAARTSSGADASSFLVTVSSNLSPSALERLSGLGVDRSITFVRAPFAEQVRRLAARRP